MLSEAVESKAKARMLQGSGGQTLIESLKVLVSLTMGPRYRRIVLEVCFCSWDRDHKKPEAGSMISPPGAD